MKRRLEETKSSSSSQGSKALLEQATSGVSQTQMQNSDETKAIASSTASSTTGSGSSNSSMPTGEPTYLTTTLSFKTKNWKDNTRTSIPRTGTGRGGGWRTLKQMVVSESELIFPVGTPLYPTIQAEPSGRPAKRYCDITGLPALYRDPLSKLQYAHSSLFPFVRELPAHAQTSYLDIRKASTVIK